MNEVTGRTRFIPPIDGYVTCGIQPFTETGFPWLDAHLNSPHLECFKTGKSRLGPKLGVGEGWQIDSEGVSMIDSNGS